MGVKGSKLLPLAVGWIWPKTFEQKCRKFVSTLASATVRQKFATSYVRAEPKTRDWQIGIVGIM